MRNNLRWMKTWLRRTEATAMAARKEATSIAARRAMNKALWRSRDKRLTMNDLEAGILARDGGI